MDILTFDQAGDLLLTTIAAMANLAFGVPTAFDFAGLLAHPTTSFVLLDELPQFALVYVMVGVAFSLAVHAVWRRLWRVMCRYLTALRAGFGGVSGY